MVQVRTVIKVYVEWDQEFEIQVLVNMSERKYSERDKSYCKGHMMKQNMAHHGKLQVQQFIGVGAKIAKITIIDQYLRGISRKNNYQWQLKYYIPGSVNCHLSIFHHLILSNHVGQKNLGKNRVKRGKRGIIQKRY